MNSYTRTITILIFSALLLSACVARTPKQQQADAKTCFTQNARGDGRFYDRPNRFRGGRDFRRGGRRAGVSEGCRQFLLTWRPTNNGSRRRTDGLGPLFNARSCVECHRNGEGGNFLVVQASAPGQSADGGPIAHPHYGLQIQDRAIAGVKEEATVRVSWKRLPGWYGDATRYELRKPQIKLIRPSYGPVDKGLLLSPRRIPTVYDTGLFDLVATTEIEKHADPLDLNGDGISGRINHVPDLTKNGKSIGRFGWKAAQPALDQQIAGAFHFDMGLSTPLIGEQNCAKQQIACRQAIDGGSPEVDIFQFGAVLEFSRNLRSPVNSSSTSPEILQGKKMFTEFQCASCHVPQQRAFDGTRIAIFTDLLLHDIGDGLADGRGQFEASGAEWRTAPLIGLNRLPRDRRRVQLLHDGRARSIAEAILWHGGEAAAAKQAFQHANKSLRKALIAYLRTL